MEAFTAKAIIAHGTLAIFGAIVHAASAYRRGSSKNFTDFLTLTLMSSFSGVMFALVALHFFGGEHYITLASAGVGGFLGVEGMTVLADRVQKFLISK